MNQLPAFTRRYGRPALAAALLLTPGLSRAQSPARTSPFLKPGQTGAPAPGGSAVPANSKFELNGVTRLGDQYLLCVTSLTEKRSQWIKVGESRNGVRVVSFDAAAGTAVIRQGSEEIPLALKQPTYDPSALSAYQPQGPLPVAGASVPTPLPEPRPPQTDEEKATEARMLVSDLLEIGMIQRKAYEEAQARERAAKPGGAPATPASPPPAPAP